MNSFSFYKFIHSLPLMKQLRIIQKTELTRKPKVNSSRKNAYFEKRLKNCLANKTFYGFDALVQN